MGEFRIQLNLEEVQSRTRSRIIEGETLEEFDNEEEAREAYKEMLEEDDDDEDDDEETEGD